MGRRQAVGRQYPLVPLPPLLLSSVPTPERQMVPNPFLAAAPRGSCTCSPQERSLQRAPCSKSCLGLGQWGDQTAGALL